MQKQFILIAFLILSFLSCLSCHKEKTTFKQNVKKSNINYISINTGNLLIFSVSKSNFSLPLIFVIDSHADTNIVKKSFNYFIRQNPCILAISLDVKNNTNDFLNKLQEEVTYLLNKFNISKIIITGFSGGARMAFYYSLNSKVDASILFGAGIDPSFLTKSLNFTTIMVCGYKDFNFIETFYSPYSNLIDSPNILSIYHPGTHEWPDSLFINEIFNLIFSKINNKKTHNHLNIPSSIMLDDFKKYEALYKLSNSNQQYYKNQLITLKNNMEFQNEIELFERTIKQEYYQHYFLIEALEKKSFDWWKNFYNELMDSIKIENFIKQSYWHRIKGYVGILVYSKLNSFYNNNEFNNLFKKILEIYKLFEPDNKEMKYFEALYFYKNGNYEKAKIILNDLISKNFTNFNRIKKDFSRLNFE